jgi:hypothetical protein
VLRRVPNARSMYWALSWLSLFFALYQPNREQA